MHAQIEATIAQFIQDNYLFGSGEPLSAEESLIERGCIDSMGVLELVTFLETTFNIQMADEELVPENLDSVRRIGHFIAGKLGADKAPAAVGSAACA